MEKNNSIYPEGDIIEVDSSLYEDDDDDDEETIIEEEKLDPIMDPVEELKLLTEDMEKDVEDLRDSWNNIIVGNKSSQSPSTSIEERDNVSVVMGMDEPSTSSMAEYDLGIIICPTEASDGETSELKTFYCNLNKISDSDDDDDEDYTVSLRAKPRRKSRIGIQYQVDLMLLYHNDFGITNRLKKSKKIYEEATNQYIQDGEEMEELLWAPPPNMTEDELDAYLYEADKIVYSDQGKSGASTSKTRVSEQALYCLKKCDYVSQSALDMLSEIVKIDKQAKKNVKKTLKKPDSMKENAPDGDYLPPKEKYLLPRGKKNVSYKDLDEEYLPNKDKKRNSKEDSDEEYLPPKEKKRYHKKDANVEYRPPKRPKK